ncbi:MAG TPA: tRNA pseudouridine(55) synthase TruB [Spirochaetota bacterium]|nr:tRNA pseudouridine(55) synthase TruB [Spirochaetota bacterium]
MTVTRESLSDAVILIDKPTGMTSFDVIAVLRKLIGTRKIGHSGTLDKAASGLLVVCTGRLTRLAFHLTEKEKSYAATVSLGTVTDSCDSEGIIISRHDFSDVTEKMVLDAIESFKGEILQKPPVFSALKIGGKRASDRARGGEEIEMKERPVTIHRMDMIRFDSAKGTIELEIDCSKGTYIRSLARDIGGKLGCGAYLSSLRRTRCGEHRIESSLTPDELRKVLDGSECAGCDRKFLLSASEAMKGMSLMVLDAPGAEKVSHGGFFTPENVLFRDQTPGLRYAVEDEGKNLIAIADVDIDNWSINYLNVFN